MKEYQFVNLEIVQDDYPESPREWDNLSTFYAVRNNHYMTGGKGDIEYTYRDTLEDEIKELRKAGAVIVEFSENAGNQYAVIDKERIK